jgi:hypothetical protein
MNTQTRFLLMVSIGSFVLGASGVMWGIGMPLGAIFFGLFLISKMLEKEIKRFDEEQRTRLGPVPAPPETPRPVKEDQHHPLPSAYPAH